MKRRVHLVAVVLVAAAVLVGCETLKGLRQDCENTFKNIQNLPATMKNVDNKIQQALW